MTATSLHHRGIAGLRKLILALGVVFVFRFIKTVGRLPPLYTTPPKTANLAFFIQVSSSTVLLIPRLLQVLHHPENIYAVHFDTHIPIEQASLIKSLLRDNEKFNNVVILPSELISYAGVTMLLNTLNAIESLLRVSSNWDFFINLSGADYPLVSPVALRELLALPPVRSGRLNMLQKQEADRDMAWFFKKRLGTTHIDPALYDGVPLNNSEVLDLDAAHPLSNVSYTDVTFVKSEGWVLLHRSFAEYTVHSAQGRRLLLSYATARAPDELFFGTLLQSSNFRDTVGWDAMRYVLWGLHGVRWSRPAFLDEVDADICADIVTSGALFARKFARPESDLMDFIDANMSGVHDYSDVQAVNAYYGRAKKRLLCIATRRVAEACSDALL